jgi:GT2 family glycosyltransferase
MNPVLILTRNNLELTKKCVESVRGQDIDTSLYVFDNGSTDGTPEWLLRQHAVKWLSPENVGVSRGWNVAISKIMAYELPNAFEPHCLVINNDVVLPSWTYRELLSYGVPFVTGVAVDVMPAEPAMRMPLQPNPDFSCFLIRLEAWKMVGPFDERMKLYCSDCALHLEAHRKGFPLWKANVPYFHINSQTLKRATPEDRAEIEAQAGRDRMVFAEMYGCLPGSPEYEQLFK